MFIIPKIKGCNKSQFVSRFYRYDWAEKEHEVKIVFRVCCSWLPSRLKYFKNWFCGRKCVTSLPGAQDSNIRINRISAAALGMQSNSTWSLQFWFEIIQLTNMAWWSKYAGRCNIIMKYYPRYTTILYCYDLFGHYNIHAAHCLVKSYL